MKFSLIVYLIIGLCLMDSANHGDTNELSTSDEPVNALVGHNIILPCHTKGQLNVTNQAVEWRFQNSTSPQLKVHVYRSQGDQPLDQHQKYKDRTSLFKDEMKKGNISLKLINVTKEDQGNYSCIVFLNPKIKSTVTLIVDNIEMIAFPVPINATVGQNITLPCQMKRQLDTTKETVEWRFQNSTSPELKVHVYRSQGDQPLDQHEKYKDRTSLFKDEMKKGNISLKLTNVTKEDEGNYTCIVVRKPKIKSNVILNIGKRDGNGNQDKRNGTGKGDEDENQDKKNLTVAFVVPVVIVIIALAIVATICCYKRHVCAALMNHCQGNNNGDANDRNPRLPINEQGGERENQQEIDNHERLPLQDLGNQNDD